MYYMLIHMDEDGRIWTELYSVQGAAEDALRASGHRGLVIAEPGYAKFTNYGLVEDLTDHRSEL